VNYHFLKIEQKNFVKIITFNRGNKGNALSIDFMDEITRCALDLNNDTYTRAVVFRGEGKHFCTGADLADPKQLERNELGMLEKMRSLESGPNMIKAIYQIPQITIAALKGKTLGGGACIASACDFRIGASDCELGYPEANYGMNLSWLGLPLCIHLVGPAKAKRLVVLGNRETADNLFQWGFIDELVEAEHLDRRCLESAVEYSKQPPIAVQMIKKSVNQLVSALDQAVMHMDKDQFMLSNLSEDYKEGMIAFLQGRDADFQGK
jgi:enoyl-CoA hydratase/carnithine racemase